MEIVSERHREICLLSFCAVHLCGVRESVRLESGALDTYTGSQVCRQKLCRGRAAGAGRVDASTRQCAKVRAFVRAVEGWRLPSHLAKPWRSLVAVSLSTSPVDRTQHTDRGQREVFTEEGTCGKNDSSYFTGSYEIIREMWSWKRSCLPCGFDFPLVAGTVF